LIEIDPKANPPVARVMDFGQFRYEQKKKESKQKKKKEPELKTLRLSLKISQHDLEYKKEQIEKFLTEKDKVKVEIMLRGREMTLEDQAKKILENLAQDLSEKALKAELPQKSGKKIFILLEPK